MIVACKSFCSSNVANEKYEEKKAGKFSIKHFCYTMWIQERLFCISSLCIDTAVREKAQVIYI